MEHAIYIVFLFAFGACVGSFLNVVVWRVPRGESVISPPSKCPKCGKPLKWYDNVPVIGWIKLRGKCRFCGQPISARYPIVEATTGLLFAGYYLAFFLLGIGPCPQPGAPGDGRAGASLDFHQHWPVYALFMLSLCILLASSLIDAELFIIPIELLWFLAPVGVAVHAIIDTPRTPGNLITTPAGAAIAAGGLLGLVISLTLLRTKLIRPSFADGGPLMEIDREAYERDVERAKREGTPMPDDAPQYTPAQIRAEMRHEMVFLLPPLLLAGGFAMLVATVAPIGRAWSTLVSPWWVGGLCGSVLGLLVGGFVVWLTRVLGTLAFGREAMGMGDVHLMAAVGAVIGAGASTVAFFLAPFFGLVLAIYLFLTGNRRELPYGPYLSMATAAVMLIYCPIAAWLAPGMEGLRLFAAQLVGA